MDNKALVNQFQPSLPEWFAAIGGHDSLSEAIRNEDNSRTGRFDLLHTLMGLPIDQPTLFEASELFTNAPRFAAYLAERGDEPCAIRLVPKKDGLPKLRNRGMLLKDCYEQWLLKQEINQADYTAEVYRHSNTQIWAASFVVTEAGIVGEIVQGLHTQLTHGEIKTPLYRFLYNFSDWQWSEEHPEMQQQVVRMVASITVPDRAVQKQMQSQLEVIFAGDLMQGYFETTVWPDNSLYFVDYNRLLGAYVTVPKKLTTQIGEQLTGSTAYAGTAIGKVVIMNETTLRDKPFNVGDILVCDNTDVRYLPLMKIAGAIVTDRGGVLSHAAIVARELKKPCVIGTKRATTTLKDGDMVEVDALKGTISRLQ